MVGCEDREWWWFGVSCSFSKVTFQGFGSLRSSRILLALSNAVSCSFWDCRLTAQIDWPTFARFLVLNVRLWTIFKLNSDCGQIKLNYFAEQNELKYWIEWFLNRRFLDPGDISGIFFASSAILIARGENVCYFNQTPFFFGNVGLMTEFMETNVAIGQDSLNLNKLYCIIKCSLDGLSSFSFEMNLVKL